MTHLKAAFAIAAVMAAVTSCGGSSSEATAQPSAAITSSAPASSAPADSSSSSAATPSATAAPAVVTIKDFSFTVPATVPAGATVQVTNDDGEAHTVTADSGGAFDTMISGKGTASFTAPAKPGRYPFHCTYHGNMHGVLVVG